MTDNFIYEDDLEDAIESFDDDTGVVYEDDLADGWGSGKPRSTPDSVAVTPDSGSGRPKRTLLDYPKDFLRTASKGFMAVGESALGLIDLGTGGRAGKYLEDTGVSFGEAKEIVEERYSPAQKAANLEVSQADGFIDTAKAAIKNPSTIFHAVVESAPLIVSGGAAGRGVSAVSKLPPWIAAAIGEGLVGGGLAAEEIRQESEDGLLSPTQRLQAVGSGAGTALFGAVGGRVAKRFGLDDIDTFLVQGKSQAEGAVKKSFAKTTQEVAKRLILGGVTEGVLEELPQSVQEQIWMNAATGKPLGEGVPNAAAMGLLTGAAMGSGMNLATMGGGSKVDTSNLPFKHIKELTNGLSENDAQLVAGAYLGLHSDGKDSLSVEDVQTLALTEGFEHLVHEFGRIIIDYESRQALLQQGIDNPDLLQAYSDVNLLKKRIENLESVKKPSARQKESLLQAQDEFNKRMEVLLADPDYIRAQKEEINRRKVNISQIKNPSERTQQVYRELTEEEAFLDEQERLNGESIDPNEGPKQADTETLPEDGGVIPQKQARLDQIKKDLVDEYVPENKRKVYEERLAQAEPDLMDKVAEKYAEIEDRLQARLESGLKNDGPSGYQANLRGLLSSATAGTQVLATARESSPHRIEYAHKLLQDFINEDLNQSKYNPIDIENAPPGESITAKNGRKVTNRRIENGIGRAVVWSYDGTEPSYWETARRTKHGRIATGIGNTEQEALEALEKQVADFEQFHYEVNEKQYTPKELDGLKNLQLRSIAHARNIEKWDTARIATLKKAILGSQKEISGNKTGDVQASLEKKLGKKAVRNLTKSGRVKMLQSEAEIQDELRSMTQEQLNSINIKGTEGFYYKGTVYLIADNIQDADHAWSIFRHELGVHAGLRGLLGSRFKAVMAQVEQLVRIGNKPMLKARQRAMDAETPAESLTEETLAYWMNDPASQKTSLYKKVVAAIRAWAYRTGFQINLTPADMSALVDASIRKEVKQENNRTGTGGMKLSKQIPKTDPVQVAVNDRIDEKYKDIIDLPESNAPHKIYQGIVDGTILPSAVDSHLKKVQNKETALSDIQAAVADRLGDLKETPCQIKVPKEKFQGKPGEYPKIQE